MWDMLSRHQNWYIRKNFCLAHSKSPTAIEALIAVCFLSRSFFRVDSRAAFINISALKCGVNSRAAYNRVNTVNTHTTYNFSSRFDEGLTLEASAWKLLMVADLRYQLS